MQSIIFINFIIFYERVILNNPMSLMQKYSSIFKIVPDHSVTNLSTSFKNSGRSDMHPFKARYSTPMHDLDYTKPILQHSPSKSPGKSGSKQKKLVKNPEAVTEFRIKSVKKADTNTALANNNNGVQLSNYQMKQNNKQTILIESREDEILKKMQRTASSINKSSPLFKTISKFRQSTFGLSDCEFSNTIIGKVTKKSAHHLDFQKMPDRQQNINKVWYSKEESFSPVDRERNRNKILANKIHFFKSDSSHKAFDVGNPFDKFYDTPYNLVKKRSDVVIRSLDKVKSRAGLEIKLGTNLDYQKDRSLQNKKRPIFEIAQTERKLKISRQVISPQKGVYR